MHPNHPTSHAPSDALELHGFTVQVSISQIVNVTVSLPETSAVAAQDYVREILAAGENPLAQLETHFGGGLTWHDCYWKVVSAESLGAMDARALQE